MEIRLKRIARRETYTIGRIYVDGKYVCDTVEDRDRGLSQSLPVSVNIAKKRKGMTAIPTGRYRVTLDVQSPKYSKFKSYAWCNGYLPRLINVPAFDGILIHAGNSGFSRVSARWGEQGRGEGAEQHGHAETALRHIEDGKGQYLHNDRMI